MNCSLKKYQVLTVIFAAIGGTTWLIGGESLYGPLLSILLPIAVTISQSRKQAYTTALIYYLIGSVSITGAITGYYGPDHTILGLLAWIGASAVLALPWMFGRSALGLSFALIATAIPPLGVIGWLSPLNAAGVILPDRNLWGIITFFMITIELHFLCKLIKCRNSNVAKIIILISLIILIGGGPIGITNFSNIRRPLPLQNWIGLQTQITSARSNLGLDITNKEALIDTARKQGKDVRVVVFPEAVLDDWWPGTQQQFSLAVPSGQIWLIGAQVATPHGKPYNAVVSVVQNKANPAPLTTASGLLLGGDWIPWSTSLGIQTGIQRTFEIEKQKVWASLCIEQLQPWTWLLAMSQKQKPTVILAMSNTWWAPKDSFAPKIQVASTKAWARLMNVPVIWANNAIATPTNNP